MLLTYPESLLLHAVDGILRGPSVGRAVDDNRLTRFARAAAKEERLKARHDANALRAKAMADGYRDGMVQAMTSLLPLLEALQQEQQALADAMHRQVQVAVESMAASPPVAVPQLVAACAQWAPDAADAPQPVLHVPEQQHALLLALRNESALAKVVIQPSPRAHVLLEVGPMAYSFDVQDVLVGAAADELQQQLPRLQSVLPGLAEQYCRQLQDDLEAVAQRERFISLRGVTDE